MSRTLRHTLTKLARDTAADPAQVDLETVTRWLANFWSPETRKSYRSSLVVVLSWAHDAGPSRSITM
ncbi:MAG: hypothetical protein ABWZ26_04695 [Candidatus Nanopelagicales bacterium]